MDALCTSATLVSSASLVLPNAQVNRRRSRRRREPKAQLLASELNRQLGEACLHWYRFSAPQWLQASLAPGMVNPRGMLCAARTRWTSVTPFTLFARAYRNPSRMPTEQPRARSKPRQNSAPLRAREPWSLPSRVGSLARPPAQLHANLSAATSRSPNARGKPRRSAKRGGDPQAQLVGVGLTAQLGFQAPLRGAHCAKETGCVVARWEAAPPKTGQSMARDARQLGWSRVTSLALVNRRQSISRLRD